MSRYLQSLLAGLGLVWLGLFVLVPLLPAPVSAAIYLLGARICHQIGERSFHVAGAQLAVCARCTGLYAGAALGLVALAAHGGMPALLAPRVRLRRVSQRRAWLAAGAAPLVISVVAEQSGVWGGSNALRAATGLLCGAAVAFVVGGAATLHLGRASSAPGEA